MASRRGKPLTAAQLKDARALGVREPERVRLLRVAEIVPFDHPVLDGLVWPLRRALVRSAGLTARYGILIRADHWDDRRLLMHEMVHVAQYERLGGIRPFLRAYLLECMVEGYPLGPLEQEAIAVTREFMVR